MKNSVTLLGNVGKDPVLRNSACNFSIATSERWRDRNSGEPQERTTWHDLVAWGEIGERIAEYVKAGDTIFVEGKLVYDEPKEVAGAKYKVRAAKIQVISWQNLGRREKREERGGRNSYRPETERNNRQEIHDDDRDADIPF